MSEKRYEVIANSKPAVLNVAIKDHYYNKNHKEYPFSKCCENHEDYMLLLDEINWICKLLNEQDAEIKKLKKELEQCQK